MVASTLGGLIVFAFASIGVGSFARPRRFAAMYGLPVDDESAIVYVRALGARDLVLGAITARLLAGGVARPVRRTMLNLIALVGCMDFALVAGARVSDKSKLLLHGGGTLGLLIAAAAIGAES